MTLQIAERLSEHEMRQEWLRCSESPTYFVERWCYLYNATQRAWIKFSLWPAQKQTLHQLECHQFIVVVKARQLGITWLALAYALWIMLFRPAAAVLLFSKRDDEAMELLSRVQGMYRRLPPWMRSRHVTTSNRHELSLSNGSSARAMPTTGGRSYTGTFVLLDEADFVADLGSVLNSLKPTVDAGGQMAIISTVDKRTPMSAFKSIVRDAMAGHNSYKAIFHGWRARPDRTQAWYDQIAADMRSQAGGSNDDLYQEYPETIEQALAPKALDKRLPFAWIEQCLTHDSSRVTGHESQVMRHGPAIPGLTIYEPPLANHTYVIGADPAEGNPNSDNSALTVLDAETWQEVASYAGRCEPTIFAGYIDRIGAYFNHADVLVERNNHGQTVLVKLQESGLLRILNGYDHKPGWLTTIRSKPLMYNALADALRDALCRIRTRLTAQELATIEAATLSAPPGLHDDRATSFALAIAALALCHVGAQASTVLTPADPLAAFDRGRF